MTQTFSKKSQAESWAKDIESSMDKGLFIDHREAEQTTMAELFVRYENEILPTKKAIRPVKLQIKQINRFIGSVYLSHLTTSVIASFRNARLKEVTSETCRKDLLLVRRVIHAAIVDWRIQLPFGNPVISIQLPKPCKPRTSRLEGNEEKQILNAAKVYGGHIHNIIRFAIETAMRRSEIVNVQWNDINFTKRTLHIDQTKTDSPRTIPLSNQAIKQSSNKHSSRRNKKYKWIRMEY